MCEECWANGIIETGSKDRPLEVHHKIHLTPYNIHDANVTLNENNLHTLCRSCHFAEHEEEKKHGNKSKTKQAECEKGFRFDENGFLIPIDSPPDKKQG